MFSVDFMADSKLKSLTGSPAMSTDQDEVLFNLKLSLHQLAGAPLNIVESPPPDLELLYYVALPIVECSLNPGYVGVAFACSARAPITSSVPCRSDVGAVTLLWSCRRPS
jgi:hypothetical protein